MKKLITIIIILAACPVFAQQDPMYTQNMFNKLAINPGYAGSRELPAIDVLYRYQWANIPGAPKTITASVHTPLNDPRLALGLNVYNDQLGPLSFTGAMATFAYRIIFPTSKLSFGLQAGVKNNGVFYGDFNIYDQDEPFLNNEISKQVTPDANFGVYYYTDMFYAGLSAQHLLQNQTLAYTDDIGNQQFTRLLTHFYLMSGVALPVSENVVFRPSLLAKFVKNAPPQLDLNASFLFRNTFWLGVSYRTVKAVSLITEFNVTQNFRIGYSYDIWLNELKSYNKGSHEIRLSYEINNNKRLLTARYF